ncbi:MAG: hypothetical protein Q9187_003425 [Circinaria calcarea]
MNRDAENSEMLDILDVPANVELQPQTQNPLNGSVVSENQNLNQHILRATDSQGRGLSGSEQKTSTARTLTRKVNGEITLGSPVTKNDDTSDDELSGEPKTPLPASSLPTGICYDPRMRFHCELDPPKDRSNFHPEDPRRIFHIFRAICETGLVKDSMSPKELVSKPLRRIPARYAKKSELMLVHKEAHIDNIEKTRDMHEKELVVREKLFDSIYFNKLTYTSALLSAGGAIDTSLAVVGGTVRNAFAVIRPPGHHAEFDKPMGFCIFDNVSVAAKVCQQKYPETCRKVLIVDWDVHHGNGIQEAFESDPNVLYISVHVHENGNFYPTGPAGDHLHCGLGAGLGKNVNIPWPTKGMGDADYLFAFQNVVMPIACEFDPDLVMVASGFDAADGDQLGGCFVSPSCYAHMTHMLMSLAGGKVVVCLEGGYNLKSISESALAVTKTLMGEPPGRLEDTTPTKVGVSTVKMVIMHQSQFWRCLYPRDHNRDIGAITGAERMHDVIRAYQSKHLYESHKMINLFVFRENISKSFHNEVLATTNYAKALPLLVIFHDPPEVLGTPNPVTNRLDLHNIWLADVLKNYIAWGTRQGFGIIDVNVPKFLTGIDDLEDDEDDIKSKHLTAMEEIAPRRPNDATRVFFLGVGEAYHAILHLMNTRNEQALHQIGGIIYFIAESPLRRASDQFVSYLSKWYYAHTRIYIENEHAIWDREQKPSKKFGTLIRSPVMGLNAMLVKHQREVEEFLLARAGIPAVEEVIDEDTIMVAGPSS